MVEAAPDIWGGDWNTSFAPNGYAGSKSSRSLLRSATKSLRLTVATEELTIQGQGDMTIDHIAVPNHWTVRSAERRRAAMGRQPLSDHDAYIIDVAPA